MKIDFGTVLKNKKGEPMKGDVKFDDKGEPIPDSGTDVTLGSVAETALLATFQDEALKLEGSEKVKRFKIAMKLDGVTEVTPEEIVTIKAVIGKAFGPMIVGRAFEILDGGGEKKEKSK